MSSIDRTFAVFFATFAFQGMVDGITFDMSGVGQKCLQEDVQKVCNGGLGMCTPAALYVVGKYASAIRRSSWVFLARAWS